MNKNAKPSFPIRSILCLADGTMRDMEDDGTDPNGKPKVRRLVILGMGREKFKGGGGRVYRRGKIVVDKKTGEKTYVPVETLGDPDLDDAIEALDEAGIQIVKKATAEREKREELMARRTAPEAAAFVDQLIRRAQGTVLQPITPPAPPAAKK